MIGRVLKVAAANGLPQGPITLSEFAKHVSARLSSADVQSKKTRRVGASISDEVKHEIRHAMITEGAQSIVRLVLSDVPKIYFDKEPFKIKSIEIMPTDQSGDDGHSSISNEDRLSFNFEIGDAEGRLIFPEILSSVWVDDDFYDGIDWQNSSAEVPPHAIVYWPATTSSQNQFAPRPSRHGSEGEVGFPIGRLFPEFAMRRRWDIFVRDPNEALDNIFVRTELPDAEWFKRFHIYRKQLTPELIAAAWRYLAVFRPEPKWGLTTKLVSVMQDYLLIIGVDAEGGQGPQRKTLEIIASGIVRQYIEHDCGSQVLVSGSPHRNPNRNDA